MITALLVDDEQKARNVLRTLLETHCPEVHIIGEAANVPAALQLIHQHNPQLVFLDIEMPGYSGLQLLELVEKPKFQVIFTTAYSEYALQAFEVSAVDYLLKPLRIEKLVQSVKKALQQIAGHSTPERLEALQRNMRFERLQQLVLPLSDGYLFIAPDDIELLEAEGSYTRIYKADGTVVLVTRLLREFEKHLDKATGFFRCHRSFLLNLNYVRRWLKTEASIIQLVSGKEVPISRDKREELERIIQSSKV